MRTPTEFIKNLKNGIVTKEMMSMVLYSFNKRAKNYRDKEHEYRKNRYDNYGNEEKFRDKKEEMYNAKEKLLTYLEPKCIHKEVFYRDATTEYYDYEYGFYEHMDNAIRRGKFYDYKEEREVEFIVVITGKEEHINYYLCYELDTFSFHSPVNENYVEKSDLEIIELKDFITHGIDVKEILSLSFCNKVLDALNNKECKII